MQGVMSIANTYRAMSEDVRRLASETKDEAMRESLSRASGALAGKIDQIG
jgi:hypothetical protein